MSGTCSRCGQKKRQGENRCSFCGTFYNVEQEDPLVGVRLGSLVLEGRIAKGGVGAIYTARDTASQRKFAVKILHPQFAQNPRVYQRFQREVDVMQSMEHSGLVKVFDFGWSKACGAYLVMELLEGMSLAKVLSFKKPLGKERLWQFTEQTLSALEHIHSRQIIHRDLKPANIFVCHDQFLQEEFKLLDFGLVKAIEDSGGENKLTRTGMVMGTPHYMAPEQASGRWDHVDHRTDLYAFGVIVYRLLAIRPPAPKGSFQEIMMKHVMGELTPLSEHRPDLKAHPIENVVHWTMSKDRDDRPSSALELKQQLLGAIKALPDDPTPAGSHSAGDSKRASKSFSGKATSNDFQWFSHLGDEQTQPSLPPIGDSMASGVLIKKIPTLLLDMPNHLGPISQKDSIEGLSRAFEKKTPPPSSSQGTRREILSPPVDSLYGGDTSPEALELMSEDVWGQIQSTYTRFIGPLSKVVIKKSLKKMGCKRDVFPIARQNEFLELLAGRLDDKKRYDFLSTVKGVLES